MEDIKMDNSNKKSRKKAKNPERKKAAGSLIIVILAVVILAAVGIGAFLINKYSESSTMRDAYEYFGVTKGSDEILVYVDGEKISTTAKNYDNEVYLPLSYVAANINARFYYDKESGKYLYTTGKGIYSFKTDDKEMTMDSGDKASFDYALIKSVDGEAYIAWDYVCAYTDINSKFYESPDRLMIFTGHDEIEIVKASKKSAIRYRAGIKSDVLTYTQEGDLLTYGEEVDGWTKVTTESGFSGYIKNDALGEKTTYSYPVTFTETVTSIKLNDPVCIGWFQVGGTAGNSAISSTLDANNCINVISPTWYSFTSTDGEMSCYASESFVNEMHDEGMLVWPLIDDFDDSVDFAAMLSSQSTRKSIIEKLISDAKSYGYDGYNLDFENVTSKYAADFLQFLRELSLECKANNIILSTDNYKPESYNSYYNLKDQACFVDYVVIMAYDEHYAGSDAGSVASISFVKECVENTKELVPADKIVLGMPFYTRIWTVNNGNTTSRAVAMQTAITENSSNGGIAIWDDSLGQYFSSYETSAGTVSIWFEEDKSIGEKMKVYQESGIAGVACWKLGLEKASVWTVINRYLNS